MIYDLKYNKGLHGVLYLSVSFEVCTVYSLHKKILQGNNSNTMCSPCGSVGKDFLYHAFGYEFESEMKIS